MKKLKCLLLVAAVVVSLIGCRKPVEVSFDSTTQELAAQGGTIEIALKSNGEWTIESTAEWIVVTPITGNGDATLTFVYEPNTTGQPRIAEVKASTKDNTASLTLTQVAPQYYVNLTPKDIQCGSDGGEFTVEVSSNIEWTVSLPPWITSSVTEGSNDATLTLTVAAMSEVVFVNSRSGEVIVAGPDASDQVNVVQTSDPILSITVEPRTLEFVCTGETKALNVTTEDAWTASVEVGWITLSQTEGDGDMQIEVTVNENPAYVTRQAVVVFTTQGGQSAELSVMQEATPDPHFLVVTPRDFQFGKEGGEREVSVDCDTDWEFSLNCDWLSVSPQSGTGSMTVVLTAEPNTVEEPRMVEFYAKSGHLYSELIVSQEAGDESLSASFDVDTLNFSYIGGLQTLQLTSNTSWQLQASEWITLLTSSGDGDATFDIIVDGNSNPEDRIGFVNVMHGSQLLGTLVVVQEGRLDILEVDITEMDVRPEGGEFTVHVTSNLSWTVNIDVDWLHCDVMSGFGNKDIVVTVDPMSGLRPRTGRIKLGGSGGSEVTITVTQH